MAALPSGCSLTAKVELQSSFNTCCVFKWKHVTPTNGYHMVKRPRSKSVVGKGSFSFVAFLFFSPFRRRWSVGRDRVIERGKSYTRIKPLILVFACSLFSRVLCLLDSNIDLYYTFDYSF